MAFNPKDHYWIIAGDETQVFSSKRGELFPVSDATYVAWTAAGGVVTRIATKAELGEVLAPYNVRPTEVQVLDGYTEAQATKLTLEVVAKALFNVVNRVRALEGSAPINANQFKSYLKGLM